MKMTTTSFRVLLGLLALTAPVLSKNVQKDPVALYLAQALASQPVAPPPPPESVGTGGARLASPEAASDPKVKTDAPQVINQTPDRPTLKEGSFGFSHANHLNPLYSFEDPTVRSGQVGPNAGSPRGVPTGIRGNSLDPFAGMGGTCGATSLRCNDTTVSYRTIDGSCNNLQNPHWGQGGNPYRRLLPRKLSLVNCGNAALPQLPNARAASNLLALRGDDDREPNLSINVMVLGQVLDHDMIMTPLRTTESGQFLDCCAPENVDAPECCSIRAPPGDFFYGRGSRPTCMPFIRSKLADFPGNCKVKLLPDIENSNTAFIDLSFVYGSSPDRSWSLREWTGGRMLVIVDNSGRSYPHIRQVNNVHQMQFGDTRGDVHPAFTLMVTTFLRNHNWLAARIQALHPGWSDEKLFQEARKINVALFQQVVYGQWMDALLGAPNDVAVRGAELQRDYYKPEVDPGISVIFSTAAFRLHTYVSGWFELRGPAHEAKGRLRLRDVFHDPLKLVANNTYDDLMRGLAGQPLMAFNNKYTTEMTEFLFLEKGKDFGLDIIALNIQRGRDHQIPGYVKYRELCGLGKVAGWGDLMDLIPQGNVQLLLHAYRAPEDVDMYVASNMEVPVMNSILGPTAHCLIREQFERLRDGDRFFFTNPGQFTPAQLASIKRTTLGQIMCRSANEPAQMSLPRNVFHQVDPRFNPAVPCSALDTLDLTPWA